jgi:glyoxylase I family protein
MTPNLTAVHHVALNVCDLERSVQWYGDVLGFTPLVPFDTSEFQRRILGHPNGVVVALSRHDHPDAGAEFNERRTGLDHLSFDVQSVAELEAWAAHLDALAIPHSGVTPLPAFGSSLIAFRDPDNIQLELYAAHGAPVRPAD